MTGDIADLIVHMKDAGASWVNIEAETGYSYRLCRKTYKERKYNNKLYLDEIMDYFKSQPNILTTTNMEAYEIAKEMGYHVSYGHFVKMTNKYKIPFLHTPLWHDVMFNKLLDYMEATGEGFVNSFGSLYGEFYKERSYDIARNRIHARYADYIEGLYKK